MNQCSATKANGQQCTLTVEPPDAQCWHHAPDRAEQRSRQASRAGRAKPSREVRLIKEEIKAAVAGVKAGDLDRNKARAMFSGWSVLLDYIKLERGIVVEDELAHELEEIRRERGHAS